MISISKELALELLMKRVEYWTNDSQAIKRWAEYIEYFVEVFEGEFDPKVIVDNLWVNEIEFIDKSEIVDNDNLEAGEEISTADFVGVIEYVGDDFIVILLR